MKKLFAYCFFLLLSGCQSIQPPEYFVYEEITTPRFKLATRKKITDPKAECRIYIEGDGYAFNAHGKPSKDPTPHGELVREISFNDPAPNVIYLARPCQYVKDEKCSPEYWTAKRFAPEVVEAEYTAIKNMCRNQEIILIGFSGGAQVAGLLAVKYPDLKIRKVITIAGNLDHKAWTDFHHVSELSGSLNLADYKAEFYQIPQTHYVGGDDEIIPPELVKNFARSSDIIEISGATHTSGWDKIYQQIYRQ
jgi:hypothetical protein